jgi:hypothetical protein
VREWNSREVDDQPASIRRSEPDAVFTAIMDDSVEAALLHFGSVDPLFDASADPSSRAILKVALQRNADALAAKGATSKEGEREAETDGQSPVIAAMLAAASRLARLDDNAREKNLLIQVVEKSSSAETMEDALLRLGRLELSPSERRRIEAAITVAAQPLLERTKIRSTVQFLVAARMAGFGETALRLFDEFVARQTAAGLCV